MCKSWSFTARLNWSSVIRLRSGDAPAKPPCLTEAKRRERAHFPETDLRVAGNRGKERRKVTVDSHSRRTKARVFTPRRRQRKAESSARLFGSKPPETLSFFVQRRREKRQIKFFKLRPRGPDRTRSRGTGQGPERRQKVTQMNLGSREPSQ
jgi:hypothetical protein